MSPTFHALYKTDSHFQSPELLPQCLMFWCSTSCMVMPPVSKSHGPSDTRGRRMCKEEEHQLSKQDPSRNLRQERITPKWSILNS